MKIITRIKGSFLLLGFGVWVAIIGFIWPKPTLQAMLNFCENVKEKLKWDSQESEE